MSQNLVNEMGELMRKNLCCLILITTAIVSISGCSSKIDPSSSITQNESDMKSITEIRTEAEKKSQVLNLV